MSATTQIAKDDWTSPATKGDLMLVTSDLNGKIDQIASDLNGKIDQLDRKIDLGLKDVQLRMFRMIWTAVATLGAVGVLLRFW